MKERELIKNIAFLSGSGENDDLLCGIGDDCAVVRKSGGRVLLYTMDTLVESVHFDSTWHPPELLGKKAVSVNVSDIAAMGGEPRYLLFSLGLPPGFDEQWALKLSRGVTEACRRYGCLLIGGDTVASPRGVSLTLTLTGEADEAQVLYRHGAQDGDVVYVSGPLGLAGGGLGLCRAGAGREEAFKRLYAAHLDPRARVELGRLLAGSGCVNAMMDLSDGLATDLAHICERSGLGARIIQERLPRDPDLEKAATLLGQDSLDWMIGSGEDYELLLTAPQSATEKLHEVVANSGHILYPVGTMVNGSGVQLLSEEGDTESPLSIEYHGFDHFSG